MIDVKAILARAEADADEASGGDLYAALHGGGSRCRACAGKPRPCRMPDRVTPQHVTDVHALVAEVERLTTLANANAQRCSDLADENARLRGLLARVVKYAREDNAQTPGTTRLARVLDECAAALGESK